MLIRTGTLTSVQLKMNGLKLPFGLVDSVFDDTVAQSIRRVLTYVSRSIFIFLQK